MYWQKRLMIVTNLFINRFIVDSRMEQKAILIKSRKHFPAFGDTAEIVLPFG